MSAPRIDSKIATQSEEFRARYDHNRALAEKLRADVAEAAKGLGVTRQQLYKVIKGESALSPEMAVRLEKAFGGSAAGRRRESE